MSSANADCAAKTHGYWIASLRRSVRRSNGQKIIHSRIIGWAAVLLCLLAWELIVKAGIIMSPSLPAVSIVAITWWREIVNGTLLFELGSTLGFMFSGYFLAAIIGVSLGLLMASAKPAWALLEPFVELLRPVPVSATVPLLVLFLGIDAKLKIVSIALGAIFPILLATYAGVKAVTATMRETACTFQLTRWQTLRKILVPSAAPHIFIGLRTSLAISLIVCVFAEMIAGSSGVGFFILQAQQTLSVDKLYAGVFMLAIVGYISNAMFLHLENLILPWRVGGARRRS